MTGRTGKRRFLGLLWYLILTCSLITGMSMSAWAQEAGTVKGADQDIVVLYTNDVHCAIDENIGYGGLALYKKQMMNQTPYVTLVDAGDAIQGAPVGTLSEGGYIIDIMNQTGYDVAVPGNHEFDYGMPSFLELAGKLNCGYYSCNFISTASGQSVFAPYKMILTVIHRWLMWAFPHRKALQNLRLLISRMRMEIISIPSVRMQTELHFTIRCSRQWTVPGLKERNL